MALFEGRSSQTVFESVGKVNYCVKALIAKEPA
ncbi:MAG: hypothetical protein ACJA0I_001441 [Gammaproteobacteria bacterium]|jgi:hypothetical protein